MHPFGETPQDCNFHDQQRERNGLEWKFASKACKLQLMEKFNLPIIQPTVIQALPSFHQALPASRRFVKEKRCPPNSPTKERRAEAKLLDTLAMGRVLPSLPRIEDKVLPSVAKRTIPSARQLPIVPTIQERSFPSTQLPEIKLRTRVRKMRRVLPIIPASQTRTPPSIPLPETRDPPTDPPIIRLTAVRPPSKWRGAPRRKRLLPSLPTIEEQNCPDFSPNEATTTEQETTSQEKTIPYSLQQKRKSSLESLQQKGNDLQGKEEDIQMIKPLKTNDVQQTTKKLAKDAKKTIQTNENKARPSLKPIDKEHPPSPKAKVLEKEDRLSKDKEADQLKVKEISTGNLHKKEQKDSSERIIDQKVPTPQSIRGAEVMVDHPDGKQSTRVKSFSRSTCLASKKVLSSCSRSDRQAKLDTPQAADQLLSTLSTDKQGKASYQVSEDGALPRLRSTTKLIKKGGESRAEQKLSSFGKKETLVNPATTKTSNNSCHKCAHSPTSKVSGVRATWSESREIMPRREPHPKRQNASEMPQKINQNRTNLSSVNSYALLNRIRRDSEASLRRTVQQRKTVYEPSFQQKVASQGGVTPSSSNSYSFLKLKRENFEILPRLRLIANRNRTESRPLAEARNSLTIKPALPCIQSTHAQEPKPPTVVKKGLPSARPKAQGRCHIKVSHPLPDIQPVVTQALPNLNSSSLQKLVKKPIPSIEGEKDSCSPDGNAHTAR